jgi:hypothetical protein
MPSKARFVLRHTSMSTQVRTEVSLHSPPLIANTMEDRTLLLARLIVIIASQFAALYMQIVVDATVQITSPLFNQRLYHDSILTGEAYTIELLTGHPRRIRTELGVDLHVFRALVEDLHNMGHNDSREIGLEEQLAMFLYTCVTGLSLVHVGERFQHTTTTVSGLFFCYLKKCVD